jgi:hypothetical protein
MTVFEMTTVVKGTRLSLHGLSTFASVNRRELTRTRPLRGARRWTQAQVRARTRIVVGCIVLAHIVLAQRDSSANRHEDALAERHEDALAEDALAEDAQSRTRAEDAREIARTSMQRASSSQTRGRARGGRAEQDASRGRAIDSADLDAARNELAEQQEDAREIDTSTLCEDARAHGPRCSAHRARARAVFARVAMYSFQNTGLCVCVFVCVCLTLISGRCCHSAF